MNSKKNHEKPGSIISTLKQSHEHSFVEEMNLQKNVSRTELIRKFKIEKDAKNKAYYFILENGHYDAFVKHCAQL